MRGEGGLVIAGNCVLHDDDGTFVSSSTYIARLPTPQFLLRSIRTRKSQFELPETKPLHNRILSSSFATAPHFLHVQKTYPLNMSYLYGDDTPADVKNAKGLHLVTQSTPNGQKVQIFLEELAEVYGIDWTTTLINIATNEQKKEWFLRLDPNGRIPILIDNTQNPPFPVHETSAELLYLLKKYDKDDVFGFKDDLERSQALQWLFFWHGKHFPENHDLVTRMFANDVNDDR